MFLELVSTDNQVSYNIKTAHLFGLEAAVYLTELLNIYAKATSKNKLDENGYFKLQRSYVTQRTTLTDRRQLELDTMLHDAGILQIKATDVDSLKVDVEVYASLLTSQESQVLKALKDLVPKKTRAEKKQEKLDGIVEGLKRSVRCSNEELRQLYYDWIDSIYQRPGGFLSKGTIKIFEDRINQYTQGDLDLALDLLKLAVIKAYKNADWVINLYQQDRSCLRTTREAAPAEEVAISNIVY